MAGRPRIHKDAAERQRAHRARYVTGEYRVIPETGATIAALAREFDVSKTEVVNSLINYALLNRNWFTLGLFGKRLPRASSGEHDESQ